MLYLEDMECLELNVAALILQQVHHQLQVVCIGNVTRHDCEVGSIQENFAQQLSDARNETEYAS